MRAPLRAVFFEAPLRFYAYADTGAWLARLLGIAIFLGVVGVGAGIGAGVAWLLHRDVESGMGVGIVVACILVVLYVLLVLSMVAGVGLAARFGSDRTRRTGRHTGAAYWGDRPVALWVVAASFGILGCFVALVTVVMAFEELPYRGPRAEADATVLSWTQGTHGRVFTVEYTADGARNTGELAIEDDPTLTVDSRAGDRTRVEYQLDEPSRMRGAGQAAVMRSTVATLALFAAGCLAPTVVATARARARQRRQKAPA